MSRLRPCSTPEHLIEILPEVGSTSAELSARLARGEHVAEGNWLIADRQSAGRGRLGRQWQDGAGNFMGSTLVRLAPGDPPAGTLALMAGLAVYRGVASHISLPQSAMLKWPNDVLVDGAKLAGILLERIGDAVVVGIGVNLATAPPLADRTTRALADFGPAPPRDSFAAALAKCFAEEIARWRDEPLAAMLGRWQAVAHEEGTRLTTGVPPIHGSFAGLCADGALRLALDDGTCHILHAGEVGLG